MQDSREWYDAYLRCDYWRRYRQAELERAGWRCERCKSERDNLHVHHWRYYANGRPVLYRERPGVDTAVLCESCHDRIHGRSLHDLESRLRSKGWL